MLLRITALILLAVAASVLHYTASPILEQNQKVRQWPSVDATVTARFVEDTPRAKTGCRRRHAPVHGATAGDEPRRRVPPRGRTASSTAGSSPTPRSEELAPAGPNLVTDREASYTRRAHYDPAKPNELFIPKAFGLGDYGQIFFWAPVFALGFGALVLRKPGRCADHRDGPGRAGLAPPPAEVLDPAPRQRGLGRGDRVQRDRGVGRVRLPHRRAADAVHAHHRPRLRGAAPRLRGGRARGLLLVDVSPGGGLRVWVDAPRATPGTRLAARFELPLKADVEIEQVVVTLACVRSEFTGPRMRFTDRVIWEQRFERAARASPPRHGGRPGRLRATLRSAPRTPSPASPAG